MTEMEDNNISANRYVLTEQQELYLQPKKAPMLVKEPIVAEYDRASFHYLIKDSARNDYAVTISWWQSVNGNLGSTYSMWGMIQWIDKDEGRLKLVNDENVQWIELKQIIDMKA
ncbi:YolD-like family protein [Brevibacillus migulae]|uniref:YolD-like family protein n=1 Tax=Brevibacillus migulae TaxID=1644114 RepID=UPI001F358202|nr:YolD-like family protein [Brevibacillus migulae]